LTIKQTSSVVIILAIILRIVTLLVSTNFGADSISRSFISLNWSFHPVLVWHPNSDTSVWLPLQFYINGLWLMLWDNVRLVPRLVSLAASLLSLPLFFGLTTRLFDREKAFFATACFSLYALHIKFGNIAGSESLFILCMLAVMYAYHRFLSRAGASEIIGLAAAMLLAAMIRFEAWILPPFIFIALIINARLTVTPRRGRLIIGALLASIPAALFMLVWMMGSFREYGDYLYSLHAASSEHIDLTQRAIGQMGNLKTTLYRAAFWPGVMLVSLSPLILVAGLWGAILSFVRRTGLIWVIFFLLQMGLYLYQSLIAGHLAPLARYTILPGTILCLFSAAGAFDLAQRINTPKLLKSKLQIMLALVLVWIILLCPNYREMGSPALGKLSSVSPVTQYPSSVEPVIEWLKANLKPDQKVIFSSPGFTSNAVIMYSGMTPSQIVSVNERSLNDMRRTVLKAAPTYLICHRQAPLRIGLQAAGLETPIKLDGLYFQYVDSAGDFGIYIPQHKP